MQMGTEGLFYEAAVEASWGTLEGAGGETAVGSLITLMFSVVMGAFLLLTTLGLSSDALTWMLVGCPMVSTVLMFFYSEKVSRLAEDV